MPPYDLLLDFSKSFSKNHNQLPVDGEVFELPGVIVYHTATKPLPEKGRLEVNTTTPEAAQTFAWHTEITLKDKVNGLFVHLILQHDGTAAETYGKTIIPIDEARAEEIMTLLTRAAS